MKNLLFAFCIILMMITTACESSDVRNGRELYQMYLNKTLIVPDEMKIYNERFTEGDAGVEWVVDVGGITRGGNHFRETMRFKTIGGGMLVVESGTDAGRSYSRSDIESARTKY